MFRTQVIEYTAAMFEGQHEGMQAGSFLPTVAAQLQLTEYDPRRLMTRKNQILKRTSSLVTQHV